MAIDLNRPISFGTGTGKGFGKAAGRYPTKTTMNLAQSPQGKTKVANVVVYGIFGVLVLALVLRFAVFDQFAKVTAAEQQVDAVQQQIQGVQAQLTGYQDVQEEYSLYSYGYQTETEAGLVDRLAMLDIIDRYVAPYGTVSAITLSENTAAVTLSSSALSDSSQLIATLKKQDLVADVSVNTAVSSTSTSTSSSSAASTGSTSSASGNVVTSVVITFQKQAGDASSSGTSTATTAGTTTSGTGA